MSAITLEMPEKMFARLKERAKSEEKPIEESVLDVLLDQLGGDPETKAEVYLKLCEKYFQQAEELLAKEDYVQASEKAWGAASQIIKALAAWRDEELRSHRDLQFYVGKLRRETGDAELSKLWMSAASLHQNFYEAWLPPETVKDGVENVKILIEKVKALFHAT